MIKRREILAGGVGGWLSSCVGAGVMGAGVGAGAGYRVCVIGHTGRGDYGHGLDVMWSRVGGVEVVGVADADGAGLRQAQERLGITAGYADYRRMLEELRPEIAVVAPRHVDQHEAMMLSAIGAGVKGIYVEKPFVRTPAEGDAVLSAARERGVRIAVAHRNRSNPVLPVLRRLLSEGLIGRVLELRGRGKEDPRGGSLDLWVLGSHVLNLGVYFGGEARACTAGVYVSGAPAEARHITQGAEGLGLMAGDELHARFELSSGVPFFFDSIRNARLSREAKERPASFGLQILGTEGVVDLRADQDPFARVRRGSGFDPSGGSAEWQVISTAGVGAVEPNSGLAGELAGQVTGGRDLVSAIAGNREPLCDGFQGLQTVEMICGVFESHRLGGRRVEFPLASRGNPWELMAGK